jgi:hypothetical protein
VQSALHDQRQQAISSLEHTQSEVKHYSAQQTKNDGSWWDGLKNTLDIEQSLNNIQQQTETAVKAAVYLLAEFVLVMVLLPILCLLICVRLFNKVFSL